MSDGRFSSKPLRSEKARDSAGRAGEFTADARLLTDAARAYLRSAAVQREINALQDHPFPMVGASTCSPLHRNTPAGATDLGRPIASATLEQEFLIGLIFLRVCGWIFMFFGVMIALTAVIAGIVEPLQQGRSDPLGIAIAGAVGLAIGGAGAWFGIFRGRVVTEMCWFCPRGMIWLTNGVFDWFVWEEVREVFCLPHAVRPAIGIRFDRNLSTISFGTGQGSRLTVETIENRASAACAPRLLQLIAEGRSVRFGAWRLSQSSLVGPGGEMFWRDVIEMQVWDREVRLRHLDGAEMTVFLDEVPFPSLFTALARGIHAFTRETASEL